MGLLPTLFLRPERTLCSVAAGCSEVCCSGAMLVRLSIGPLVRLEFWGERRREYGSVGGLHWPGQLK